MEKEIQLTDSTEIVVRFNEADPLGIVWHGHYIRYFEDGRESFGNTHGLRYLDFYRQGVVVPVVSIQCDYKRALRYGDSVVVETLYQPCDAARLEFSYRLYNAVTRELVATGSSVQVFLDKDTNALQLTNPAFYEAWKTKHGLM
ncbi:acyl-CoA thioesterase [Dinghuibacter silviterrae]|uniref:Acyl-CoA thioester hydrolase n=1 Tax=Dinghuibacter silviterrae TaxID=1539049 RepID=A0A4R8DXL0_9BACT|nr:acyl-CoA thioesterase [Dinghuibacter silviterrae]TDX02285.1 acyl-CoA thioester hydrolase [Dinghuibacter silviterrae]